MKTTLSVTNKAELAKENADYNDTMFTVAATCIIAGVTLYLLSRAFSK